MHDPPGAEDAGHEGCEALGNGFPRILCALRDEPPGPGRGDRSPADESDYEQGEDDILPAMEKIEDRIFGEEFGQTVRSWEAREPPDGLCGRMSGLGNIVSGLVHGYGLMSL